MKLLPDDMWNSLSDDQKRYEFLNHLLTSLYVISTEGPFSWAIDRRHDGIRPFFNKDVSAEAGDKRNLRRAVFDLIDRTNQVHYIRVNIETIKGVQFKTSGGWDDEKLADGSMTAFWREASYIAEKCLDRFRDAERKNKVIFQYEPDMHRREIPYLEEIIQEGDKLFRQPEIAPASPNIGPKPN